MNSRVVVLTRILPALVAVAFVGCADGNVTRRNDGVVASQMGARNEASPVYEQRVRDVARRLREENPDLSRKDALKQARKKVPMPVGAATSGPSAGELQKREAQKKFEAELAEMQKMKRGGTADR